MSKRECRDCGENINGLHGNAIFCKKCSYKHQLANARRWWKKHNYSQVVADKRDKNKDFFRNKYLIDKNAK